MQRLGGAGVGGRRSGGDACPTPTPTPPQQQRPARLTAGSGGEASVSSSCSADDGINGADKREGVRRGVDMRRYRSQLEQEVEVFEVDEELIRSIKNVVYELGAALVVVGKMERRVAGHVELDSAVFQVSLTKNRYEAITCNGERAQSEASGPFDQLVLHLDDAKNFQSRSSSGSFKLLLSGDGKGVRNNLD